MKPKELLAGMGEALRRVGEGFGRAARQEFVSPPRKGDSVTAPCTLPECLPEELQKPDEKGGEK